MNEKEFLESYNIHDFDISLTSVDMAIFAIIAEELHVLLVKRIEHPSMGLYSLPGGFINLKTDQVLDDAAYRKLKEKTGISSPYLEQVETIGGNQRDPRGWSVTSLYFALIDNNAVDDSALGENALWLPVKLAKTKKLAFDHALLLEKAFERLQSKTAYTALPIELLPAEFTLTELQTIFEIILDRKLPVKSFRRRVQTSGVIEATGGSKISGKRSAQLFRSTGLDRNFIFPRPLVEK